MNKNYQLFTACAIVFLFPECPPVLFEVRCQDHRLEFGGLPWHYIMTPPGKEGIFDVYSVADNVFVSKSAITCHLLFIFAQLFPAGCPPSNFFLFFGPKFSHFLFRLFLALPVDTLFLPTVQIYVHPPVHLFSPALVGLHWTYGCDNLLVASVSQIASFT